MASTTFLRQLLALCLMVAFFLPLIASAEPAPRQRASRSRLDMTSLGNAATAESLQDNIHNAATRDLGRKLLGPANRKEYKHFESLVKDVNKVASRGGYKIVPQHYKP